MKDKILVGYKKAKEMVRDSGQRMLTQDLVVQWNGKSYDFKAGWHVPDVSDEMLARISYMEDLTCQHFMAKDITYDDIQKVVREVFGDE
ncbi:MAG: hypothetical protein ACRCZ0_09160 [Cetobacterium sp.]